MIDKEQRRKDRATFSIGEDYLELLRKIAELERTDMTKLLRSMTDERAQRNGLQPIVKR